MDKLDNLNHERILIIGLAREGFALAGFLAKRGARVTVSDAKATPELKSAAAELAELGVRASLGGHPEELLDEHPVIFVSPGVPLDIPFLRLARQKGKLLSTETRLFCQLCPAPITAITGSSGKTTTTTLAGEMLRAQGLTVHIGGNIGTPLITVLDLIKPSDQVVMELSSFQLEYFHTSANAGAKNAPALWQPLRQGWSPKTGAILNITPNHLDRHPTMADYIRAKRAILDYRTDSEVTVLGYDNPTTRRLGEELKERVIWFSLKNTDLPESAIVKNDMITLQLKGRKKEICPVSKIKLRGEHNLYNVLAASALAALAGAEEEAMATVITSFTGVEHQLQLVREKNEVRYYNDSIATSPERMMAALYAFDEPIVLLAGGRDKHLPWDEAARLILKKVRHLVLFGEAAELIAQAVVDEMAKTVRTGIVIHRCEFLDQAVSTAASLAVPGDVVLLSPGCTSFDAFSDFAERGEYFRRLAREL